MTPPWSCLTCGLTRTSSPTRTPASCAASPPSPHLCPGDLSWRAMMTSTLTSGTRSRQREWVSEQCLTNSGKDRQETKTLQRKQCHYPSSLHFFNGSFWSIRGLPSKRSDSFRGVKWVASTKELWCPVLCPKVCWLGMTTEWAALEWRLTEWPAALDPGTASWRYGTEASQKPRRVY